MSSKRTPMPLLLESFPVPPSHIPLTPTGPPPSRPPSLPLPPVPGPSKISEHETLLFLTSRRSSRLSFGARPHSTTSSAGSISPSNSQPEHPKDEAVHPLQLLTRLTVSPAPLSDGSDDEQHRTIPLSKKTASTIRRRIHNPAISSIDMRDLPLADEQDEIPSTPTPPVDPLTLHLQMRAARSRSASHKQALRARSTSPSRAKPAVHPHNPPPLPSIPAPLVPPTLAFILASPKTSDPSRPHSESPTPARAPARSTSPDIKAIIQSTPRPRGKSSSYMSAPHSRSPSPSRVNIPGLPASARSSKAASDGILGDTHRPFHSFASRVSRTPAVERSSWTDELGRLRYGDEDEEDQDYGVPLSSNLDARWDKYGSGFGFGSASAQEGYAYGMEDQLDLLERIRGREGISSEEREAMKRLEKQLEGRHPDGGSDTDSSLDLHTPLPHLMLRHGLLSPNSKLLPQKSGHDKQDSVVSVGSMRTTSGVMKDERDTPKRRHRHRDGKLLRGGVGLTTGLGWSDSEDEGAPSPLTRRISSLNLSRRSSGEAAHNTFSGYSKRSVPRTPKSAHPLSRSYSSATPFGRRDEDTGDFGDPVDPYLVSRTSMASAPPGRSSRIVSGGGKMGNVSAEEDVKRASVASAPASGSSRSGLAVRYGKVSGSAGGLSPGGYGSSVPPTSWKKSRSSAESSSTRKSSEHRQLSTTPQEMVRTPSTSSARSIAMPATPRDEQGVHDTAMIVSPTPSFSMPLALLSTDREKSLPPLPALAAKSGIPGLKRLPSTADGNGPLRPRVNTAMTSSMSTPSPGVAMTPVTHRPLQLGAGEGDRPAVPVPGVGEAARMTPGRPTVKRILTSSRSMASLTTGASPAPPPPTPLMPTSPIPPQTPLLRSASGYALRQSGVMGRGLNSPGVAAPPPTAALPGIPSAVPRTPTATIAASSDVVTPRPRPRIGTGMTYRTSQHGAPSRMRLPSMVAPAADAGAGN